MRHPSRPRSASSPSDEHHDAKPARPRVFAMSFASVYPLYVQKAERKGRTQAEVDAVICWLTGYDPTQLQRVLTQHLDFEAFFAGAPQMNPRADQITGVVCGVRVEAVQDPLMQKIRYLDKLVDELAKGKSLERVLRKEPPPGRATPPPSRGAAKRRQ